MKHFIFAQNRDNQHVSILPKNFLWRHINLKVDKQFDKCELVVMGGFEPPLALDDKITIHKRSLQTKGANDVSRATTTLHHR